MARHLLSFDYLVVLTLSFRFLFWLMGMTYSSFWECASIVILRFSDVVCDSSLHPYATARQWRLACRSFSWATARLLRRYLSATFTFCDSFLSAYTSPCKILHRAIHFVRVREICRIRCSHGSFTSWPRAQQEFFLFLRVFLCDSKSCLRFIAACTRVHLACVLSRHVLLTHLARTTCFVTTSRN